MRPHLRYSIVALMLLASLAAVASRPAAADHAVELYRGEQFDYFFFYDASTWDMIEQETVPGSDHVRFSDGDVWVSYWTFSAPGMTPEDCLETILNGIVDDPSVMAVEESVGVDPRTSKMHGGSKATLVVIVDGSDGVFKLATLEECEHVVPDQVLMYTSINVPAASFNEGRRFDQPWIKGYLPYQSPVMIFDPAGRPTGTIQLGMACLLGDDYVIARCVSGGNFRIDPSGFVAAFATGETVPVFAGWVYPRLPSDSSMVLRQGEFGLLKIESMVGSFSYTPPGSSPVVLGSWAGGCGAGAAAPVIIDMD